MHESGEKARVEAERGCGRSMEDHRREEPKRVKNHKEGATVKLRVGGCMWKEANNRQKQACGVTIGTKMIEKRLCNESISLRLKPHYRTHGYHDIFVHSCVTCFPFHPAAYPLQARYGRLPTGDQASCRANSDDESGCEGLKGFPRSGLFVLLAP